MNYIDDRIVSPNTSRIMMAQYNKISTQTLSDLSDIRNRLSEQKSTILKINQDGRYTDALNTLDQDIRSLSRLISSGRILSTTPDVYGKIPSEAEMERMNSISNPNNNLVPNVDNVPNNTPSNPPLQNNSPNATPPINTIPPTLNNNSDNATTRPRRYPMQGNIISNLLKAFSLKTHKKKKEHATNGTPSHNTPPHDISNNRFHNMELWGSSTHTLNHNNDCSQYDCWDSGEHAPHHTYDSHSRQDCDHHRKAVTGQMDCLRLLLLFIALHPHHTHLPKICSIADSQMSILLSLMD
ncbi:MAG: hypothetical protein E7356_05225 [Clostridiales bacterium]|nr:hypothetical protein [Clostridiales bacterium]